MFTVPPKKSVHDIFTGTIYSSDLESDRGQHEHMNIERKESEEYDVWKWMKDGELSTINLERRKNQIWTNMTHIYPSPRMERMFSQWSMHNNERALEYFLQHFCQVGPFDELTFIWQHLEVMPPSSSDRFGKRRKDTVFSVKC